jgi:hypothetical protein
MLSLLGRRTWQKRFMDETRAFEFAFSFSPSGPS